ncbi:hypothetical protein [Pseudonocardia sp. GCM10023141]|uniref:hypothetical protein n=1 Tax=Pseudonocardia sp. GCM10023141 TaxID=3252653 RepID=UPI00361669CC
MSGALKPGAGGAPAAVEQGIREIRQGATEIIDAVDGALAVLPDEVVAWAREALETAGLRLEEFLSGLRRMCDYAGSPDTLRATGSTWNIAVGAAVSSVGGSVTLDRLRVDDRWSGVAADAYRNTLPAQREALVLVKQIADDVDAGLQELAGAIESFWNAVTMAVLTLAAAIASAVIGVSAPPSALIALAALVATLTAGIAFLANATAALTTITNVAAARAAALDRALATDTAFPAGCWPVSTTDMTDGSLTDGDDTDWHVR